MSLKQAAQIYISVTPTALAARWTVIFFLRCLCFSRHMKITDCILVGWLQSDCINKGLCSSIHVPQPKIGKSYQVITVRLIPFIQVIIKNQEVRKRYRKITYPHYIKDMLLSIVQKLVKPCLCLYGRFSFSLASP